MPPSSAVLRIADIEPGLPQCPQWPTTRRTSSVVEGPLTERSSRKNVQKVVAPSDSSWADVVEKVASRFFLFARAKIDPSDRPASRSRPLVKGEKTPGNLARETDSDFFNNIGRVRSVAGESSAF